MYFSEMYICFSRNTINVWIEMQIHESWKPLQVASQNLGTKVLKPTPRKIGAKTTWNVETTMPPASTGTTAPNTTLQIKGVIKMHPRVVEVVIRT